jgi:hypothetical protein
MIDEEFLGVAGRLSASQENSAPSRQLFHGIRYYPHNILSNNGVKMPF